MVSAAPAPSARMARSWGRGGTFQSKAGGQTTSIQGETEGAKNELERKDKDGSNESNNGKDQDKDDGSKSTSSEESKTEEPSKPPTKIQASTKPSQDNINEGKEGTADDDEDDDNHDPLPHDVEARCKGRKKGGRPHKGTTGEFHAGRLASQMARAAGDFGTPKNCECQAMFAQAFKTLVSRMFVSLGLADDIIDATVDEQGYDTPHAFSCLDKKGIKQLMNTICKPGGMKGGTWNPVINVPLQLQELIMGAYFALKHHRRCGEKFHPSLVNLNILEELQLQQEIKDTHNNKVTYDSRPVWGSKNCAMSADLIKQHFRQIRGMDSAPCTYLMREHIIPLPVLGTSCAKSSDNQMIKCYPIIKLSDLLSNLPAPDVEPSLKFYTCKAAENNAHCFLELKCIVQGTKAEVYIDEFNIH